MAQRTRWWQAILLSIVSISLVFTLLELGARTLSWNLGKGFWSRPHSFESAFFVTYDWPPPLIENGQGTFRTGQTVPMAKSSRELRVICLGGSTTVNARNKLGLTYSQEMQAALRPLFPQHEVWVLNAGADAFSTAHSLANLSLRLVHFEPDVITVMHNINDLTVRQFGDEMLPDYSNKYLDDAFLAYEHRSGFGGTIFRLSRGAQLLKWRLALFKKGLERSSRGAGVGNPELGPSIFKSNLRSIVAVSRVQGARPVLITQAHRDGETSAESGRFQGYNGIIRQVAEESGTALADISSAVSGRQELFLDTVHFTSPGVRMVAEVLAPIVATELAVASSAAGAEITGEGNISNLERSP